MMNQDDINGLLNAISARGKVREFRDSEVGKWFENVILGTLHDEAVELLAKSSSEADRLLAQQTLLASRKPISLMEKLSRQGELAEAQLQEELLQQKSLPQEGENQ